MMTEQDPDKDVSATKQFVVTSESSNPTEMVIDVSQLEGAETLCLDWGNGLRTIVDVICTTAEQINTSIEKNPKAPEPTTISLYVDAKAFEPGYVFKKEELPEHKKYLAGALCIGGNDDGSFLAVSAEMLKEGETLRQFNQKMASQYGCSASMGTHDQWSVLLDNKELTHLADIDDDKAYWVYDPNHSVPNTVPVRWSCENSRMMYVQYNGDRYGRYCKLAPNKHSSDYYHSLKDGEVGGRAFSVEEEFDLVDVAPQ